MLKSMSSSEITEWMAYFRIKLGMDAKEETQASAGSKTYHVLKSMFSNRIIKKKK